MKRSTGRALARARLAGAIAVLVLVLPLANTAGAEESDSSQAAPQLKHTGNPVVRGRFTQKKYLHDLQKPLASHGRFVLARGRGLIWRVEKPIRETLVITNSALIQRHKGKTVKRISRAKQPGLRMVTGLMLAVFNADTRKLEHYFTVHRTATGHNGWRMTLDPDKNSIKQVVSRIKVRGGNGRIHRIQIKRANGDRSVIKLSSKATQHPKPLTAHEKQLFSGA